MSALDSAQWVGLALIALVLSWAILSIVLDVRDARVERARQKRLAMRRHPSARPAPMSDAERNYHQSTQWGR